jgi:UDP-N-acetylmuramoyl-L-alanyl-D-glutamate--2,6-diaminopimelate ligase
MLESPGLRSPDGPFGRSFDPPHRTLELATEHLPPTAGEGVALADLAASVHGGRLIGDPGARIRDVTYRSAAVRPGSLFFCVPGERADGHQFAPSAVEAGAVALVVERRLGLPTAQLVVPSVRLAMGPVSASFFGHPAERLTVIGVTGTNGKTTTTYLLESIFRAAGIRAGVIGTTGVRIDGSATAFDRTTPEAPDLQRLMSRMVAAGVGAVAMEVSSHGLDQSRVEGTRYACAIFTNLSQDHLDYHGSMDRYFKAKSLLFTSRLSAKAVVNADSAAGRRLADEAVIPTVTFGLSSASDVIARDVEVSGSGLSFTVDSLKLRSRLRGKFNVYNCLGAVVAAREVQIEDGAIADGIASLGGVPGRMEPVEGGQPFSVLVDYAHTPDSLDSVLRTARELTPGRLIVVFGCGGDRDQGKRPLMGKIATRLADVTVLTSDNPRSEDPNAIIAEIELGARDGEGAYLVEPDRRLAIGAGIREADPGDVVVIAGKGHETSQEFRDRTVPFDDRAVAAEQIRSILRERGEER